MGERMTRLTPILCTYVGLARAVYIHRIFGDLPANNTVYIELARTIYIYIRCIYGKFGREITQCMVMYGVYVYGSGQPYKQTLSHSSFLPSILSRGVAL